MKKLIYCMMAIALLFGCATENETEKTGSIYGVITDNTGEPIRTANVQLNTGTKATLGNDGQYEIADIEAGNYTLNVTKSGYKDWENIISLKSGERKKVDVVIEKLPAALHIIDVNDVTKDISTLEFGTDYTERTFNIFNDGSVNITWNITNNCKWISKISVSNGILQANRQQAIVVTINRDSLADGVNVYNLNITSDNGSKELKIMATRKNVSNDYYVVLDAAGIMVQKEDIGEGDWNSGYTMCKNSIVGNYTDWRLPTESELMVLYNERNSIGGFITVSNSYYWSGTLDYMISPLSYYYSSFPPFQIVEN